jgi:cell wall assembly regulator SMI1
MPVPSLLTSIEGWLAANAPATLTTLAPPASPAALAEMERELEVVLLPEVRALLSWHDGAVEAAPTFELLPGYEFLGTGDILATASMMRQYASGPRPTWSRSWIPVAADRCGAYLLVDHHAQDGGAQPGAVMISDHEDPLNFWETWSCLEEALTSMFDAARHGTPYLQLQPAVADGMLVWTEPPAPGPSGGR